MCTERPSHRGKCELTHVWWHLLALGISACGMPCWNRRAPRVPTTFALAFAVSGWMLQAVACGINR
eukprot:8719603-Alexandrium_andersonii.AAC.1